MRKYISYLLTFLVLSSGLAIGKLPAPTPEEVNAAEATKVKQEEQLQKEKVLLERVQDRIATQYGNRNATSRAAAGAQTSDKNMPKTTSELPRGVGPTPARPQSAEAHSAPAK